MSLLINVNIKNQDVITKNKEQSLQNRQNYEEGREENAIKKEVKEEKDERQRETKDIVYNSSNPRQLEPIGEFPYHEIGAGGMLPYRFGGCFVSELLDEDGFPVLQITNLNGAESVNFSPSFLRTTNPSENIDELTVDLLTETEITKEHVRRFGGPAGSIDYIILPGPRESCIVYCWAIGNDFRITITRRISYSASVNKSDQASPDCGGDLVDNTVPFEYKEYIEGPEIAQMAEIDQVSFGTDVAAFLITNTEIRQISAPSDAGEIVSKLSQKIIPGQILSQGTETRGTVLYSGWSGGLEPFRFDNIYYNLELPPVNSSNPSYYKIYDISYGGIEYQDFPYGPGNNRDYHEEKQVLFMQIFGIPFWFEGNPWIPYGELSGRANPSYQEFENFQWLGGYSECYITAERPPNAQVNDVVYDDRFRKDWGYLVNDNDPTGRWIVTNPTWQVPEYTVNDSGLNTFDLFYSPLSSIGLSGIGASGLVTPGIFFAIGNLSELQNYQDWNTTQIVEHFPDFAFPRKSATFVIESSSSSVDTVTFFGYAGLNPSESEAAGRIVSTMEISSEFGAPNFTWDWNRPNECVQLLEQIGFNGSEI